MKIAILLGVPEYLNISDLPACRQDVQLLKTILSAQAAYEEILDISSKMDASVVKQQVVEFFRRHRGAEVEEFFFYYTGHGAYIDDEYYYLLSDYQKNGLRQTALENKELDGLIRGLSPRLTGKIVDACGSGVPYIKDQRDLQSYLDETKSQFRDCYFLFSSRSDESSYQDQSLSYFTREIGKLVGTRTGVIRYKDVIDYVSDAFTSNSMQTPRFVIQADFTDQFCEVDERLQNRIKEILALAKQALVVLARPAGDTGTDLTKRVQADAQAYCTKAEAFQALDRVESLLAQYDHPTESAELFEVTVSKFEDYANMPNRSTIGKWLEDSHHEYFAEPKRESVRVRKLRPAAAVLYGLRSLSTLGVERALPKAEDFVEVTEERIVGVAPTIEMPYACLALKATTRFPNVNSSECFLAPFISRRQLALFYGMRSYVSTGWDEELPSGQIEWQLYEATMKDEEDLKSAIQSIVKEFWHFTMYPIKKKFGSTEADEATLDALPASTGDPTAEQGRESEDERQR